ncbi:MAG TPA: signal peptide peptidase SppA [Longimicrobiaceae bacterium]|nr:signal peptide peptidase SppA [Longimicrobiaceae bacterium]
MAEERNPPRRSSRLRRVLVRILAGIGAVAVLGMLLLLIALLAFSRTAPVPRQAILELNLEEGLVEYVPHDPLAQAIEGRRTSVRDVVEALRRAAADDRVVALVARVGSGGLGLGQVEEIRDAVTAFRASGKPALIFSETFGDAGPGHGGYYLATAFDSIFLQPSGDLSVAGLRIEVPFLAGTLDRVGIEPRIGQRYEYKDAPNLFTEREFTAPQREAYASLLEGIYGQLVRATAGARGLSEAQVREAFDRGPLLAGEALSARLVDRLAYRDEVYDSLRARVGGEADFLFLPQYLRRAGRPHSRGERIALIYGVGGVQQGESEFNPVSGGLAMGSETVARAFRQAIEDDGVRAILFRIDSPGGSYVASDAIWREVIRARNAGKPVIVSMGNVAASGGYFVAMAADRIVAQPSTLTGSIGVYSGKVLITEASNRLGITWDAVEVGDNTTMWSPTRDYSPEERARLDASLDRIYHDFTNKAAHGRGMTREQVHEVARGRVWTGADAQRLGLVDELGGFEVALRLAREAAGIDPDADLHLKLYPEERTFLETMLDRGPESSWPTGAGALAVRTYQSLQPLLQLARRTGLLGQPGVLTMPPLEIR